MYRKKIVWMLLLSLIPIALVTGLEFLSKSRRELSDFRVTELTVRAGGFEVDAEADKEISYEREITDSEVVAKLWKMIAEQQKQPEIKGGHYLGGTPYLLLQTPNGLAYRLSYTWDREEGVCDEYEEPGTSPAGWAFVVSGMRSGKYRSISPEAEEEFEKLIMDYLRTNATPEDGEEKPWRSAASSKEKVGKKSAGTDAIVFVNCHRDWDFGYHCNGSFIDCWGNVYTFDYSDEEDMSEEEFRQALWETYCNTEPVQRGICDSERLFEILIEDVYEIERGAKFSGEYICDSIASGQETLYVCDCDFELIELYSERGCDIGLRGLQDRTAKRLCQYYNDVSAAYQSY